MFMSDKIKTNTIILKPLKWQWRNDTLYGHVGATIVGTIYKRTSDDTYYTIAKRINSKRIKCGFEEQYFQTKTESQAKKKLEKILKKEVIENIKYINYFTESI